ncbi:hypothetical protein M404DRAFT_117015, partial [Pisolithus tinctorius Marx 270]
IPCCSSPEAPRFSRCPKDLEGCLDDISWFCQGCGISDAATQIELTLKYAPPDVSHLWSHFVESSNENWVVFVIQLFELYPEIKRSDIHTKEELQKVVRRHVVADSVSWSSLGEYLHAYQKIALFLIKNGCLTMHQSATLFLKGFPPQLKDEITCRLSHLEPPYSSDEPDAIYNIMSAVQSII